MRETPPKDDGRPGLTVADMRALKDSWLIAMRGAATPAGTIKQYEGAARLFLAWCDQHPGTVPDLSDPAPVRLWLGDQAAAGLSHYTLNTRLAGIRAFAAWLLEEKEVEESAIGRVKWAKPGERVPPYLTEDQQASILRACAGREILDLRDAALFSTMFDGLVRSDEAVSMTTDDVNLQTQVIRVRRGKGGRERYTLVSPATVTRLDRYQRGRRKHRLAGLDAYWIGQKGALTYRGLYHAFKRRTAAAGIEAHPHMLRAGGAVTWRRRNGSTESLMTIAGWRSIQMVMLYTRAAEIELALAEARRLHQN